MRSILRPETSSERYEGFKTKIERLEAEIDQVKAKIEQPEAARRLAKMSGAHPNHESILQAAGQ